jgi:hypothetical protein
MKTSIVRVASAAVAGLSILGLSMQARAGAGIPNGPPGIGRTAGPIEVFANISADQFTLGGFANADVAVVNNSDELTVTVALRGEMIYSNGRRQHLFFDSPFTLPPESGLVQFGAFLVPTSAATGQATLVATAVVTAIPGAGSSHQELLIGRDSDTVEIVAP